MNNLLEQKQNFGNNVADINWKRQQCSWNKNNFLPSLQKKNRTEPSKDAMLYVRTFRMEKEQKLNIFQQAIKVQSLWN